MKKENKILKPSGWISTDAEEIQKRHKREQTELIKICSLHEKKRFLTHMWFRPTVAHMKWKFVL